MQGVSLKSRMRPSLSTFSFLVNYSFLLYYTQDVNYRSLL